MTCQTKITRKDAQIQVKDFIRRLNEPEQAYIHSSYLSQDQDSYVRSIAIPFTILIVCDILSIEYRPPQLH